ncbi:MAG: helix-hairpin-helix domain-containing protein, partial [Atribacterota bacterium]|nr:helix-hairpin-helix domain-containing protein [Atribacterota bacterium]
AQRIIEYREQNGSFSRSEELLKVKGIGEKKLEAIKDLITF